MTRGRRHGAVGIRRGVRSAGGGDLNADLGFSTGLVYRLAADLENVTLVSTKVSGWADTSQAKSAHDLAQTTDADRPVWNQAQVNGYTSMRYSSGLSMTTPAHADFVTTGKSVLFWYVLKINHAGAWKDIGGLGTNTSDDNYRVWKRNTSPIIVFTSGNNSTAAGDSSTGALPDDAWAFLGVGVDFANTQCVYKVADNALERVTLDNPASGESTVPAGLHYDASFDTEVMDMREHGLHVFDGELTDANMNAVAAYAAGKYGVSV